jgi:hypothetical protein
VSHRAGAVNWAVSKGDYVIRVKRLLAVGALAAGLLGGGVGLAAPASAAAAGFCVDGQEPPSGGITVRTTLPEANVTVELRYHPDTTCAWGRITNAWPGFDHVWVDRAPYAGADWDGPLLTTYAGSDGVAYTPALDDNQKVMRACAWIRTASQAAVIRCTDWF